MADIKTAQQTLVRRIQETAEGTTDLEKLAYASSGLEKLASQSFDAHMASDMYSIGKAGEQGFGVAAIADEDLPVGFLKLYGHDDITSPNYGNVLDNNGSVMVWIPKFYFKIEGNVVFISDTQETGYVIHRAFVDNGTKKGFFVDKYGCGNVGGKFMSKQGIDPVSTNSAHNPISALNNAPANNYGGLYTAVQTRGVDFALTSVFIYKALALLAYAQGQAATSSANCAFIDIDPKMPKGNLVSALHDANDVDVTFTASGYSDCALTGSGNPFAKTTHNGQSCGVADLNGNMWEVAAGITYFAKTSAVGSSGDTSITMAGSGLEVGDVIYFGGTPAAGSTYNTAAYTITAVSGDVFTLSSALERDILSTDGVYSPKYFRVLKETAATTSITDDSTVQAAGGAYDIDLYDLVDFTGSVNNNDGSTYFGNGANQVFEMSADTNTDSYKRTSVGIPLADGVSTAGTTQFGNDYLYRYLRNEMACLVGGHWGYSSLAGVFAMVLSHSRTSSHYYVGGRASYFV